MLLLSRIAWIFFLIFLTAILTTYKSTDFMLVKAQEEYKSTTANVTVTGWLGPINVTHFPVNFTVGSGLAPLGDNTNYSKTNEPYLNVTILSSTVNWNISVNASDMISDDGYRIADYEIKFNRSCCNSGGCVDNATLVELSNAFQSVCENQERDGHVLIYFYLDIPAGQPPGTYYGNLTFYAHSNEAGTGVNNRIWYGEDNTTVTVRIYKEIHWSLTPIQFGVATPGTPKDAELNEGWPTNITVDARTNIFVDLYVNGTDLNWTDWGPVPPTGETLIDSHNITYANSTWDYYDNTGPYPTGEEVWHLLENERPATPPYGDFANWASIKNNTDVYSYWNITVPNVEPGDYYGDVIARVFDEGTIPAP